MKIKKVFIPYLSALLIPAFCYARIDPPTPKLGVYVTDKARGLDTDCLFNDEGPLIVSIQLPTIVGKNYIASDGHLIDIPKLIQNKVLRSAYAEIKFPGFDIDDHSSPPEGHVPEMDKISWNGVAYGTQSGYNNLWEMQSIIVPLSELTFGEDHPNELRIDIDTGNPDETWCTALDWVSIKIDVAAPYVLTHGIASDQNTWDEATAPGVIKYLDDLGVVWNRWSVPPNGSIQSNADILYSDISEWLKTLQVDRFHIIAHSKGGLDAQVLGKRYQSASFNILSLTSLSTPHMGSVAGDLNVIARRAFAEHVSKTEAECESSVNCDPNGYSSSFIAEAIPVAALGMGPGMPGVLNLMTNNAATASIRGSIPTTFSIGASADINRNGTLDANDGKGMLASFLPGPLESHFLDSAWESVGLFQNARMLRVEESFDMASPTLMSQKLYYAVQPNVGFIDNDIVVNVQSANPDYASPLGNSMGNHTTVKSLTNVQKVVENTIEMRGEQ